MAPFNAKGGGGHQRGVADGGRGLGQALLPAKGADWLEPHPAVVAILLELHARGARRVLDFGRICRGDGSGASAGLPDPVHVVPRVASGLVGGVMNRRRWGCDKSCHRTYGAADRSAEGRTVATGSRSPDGSPAARADEAAANETLHRIVWIGASREAEDQPDRNHAEDNLWSYHKLIPGIWPDPPSRASLCTGFERPTYERRTANLHSDE